MRNAVLGIGEAASSVRVQLTFVRLLDFHPLRAIGDLAGDADFAFDAVAVAPQVDAILLDSGNQQLAVKELGGTGRRHDWAISRRIRETVGVPMFLAGGLNAANVREAIRAVRPFGVDVCSGVRTEGRLDAEKLAAFFAAVRV